MSDLERRRRERTGRHLCASCLKEIEAEEYFANDFYCRPCAETAATFPLATTPGTRKRDDEK